MIGMLRGILSNKKKDPITIQRIPITKARINLGQIVRRVHVNKEYFVLEKDGIPVAGIIDVDELEDYLELRDPTVKRQIRESGQEYRRGEARDADELVASLKHSKR